MAFVPPGVANANAQAALNRAVDLPAGPANVRVSRSAKRRKLAEDVLATGDFTEAEHWDHEGRCIAATGIVVGDGGGGPPAWFGPALAAGLAAGLPGAIAADPTIANLNATIAAAIAADPTIANMNATIAAAIAADPTIANMNANLANVNANLANVNANIANVNASLVNINARQVNFMAVDQNAVLAPLNDAAGNPDPNFPATLQALNSMNGPTLAASLGHYGLLAGGPIESRRRRFKKFIGIRL